MNQTIKNVMGGVIAVALLAVAYAALSYVNSYGQMIQPSSFRSFYVTGEGKTTTVPDVAEFSFQVTTEGGTDISALQAKNTDATNKAIAFVKAQGVADKDITTQAYNVEPRYQTYECKVTPVTYNSAPAISNLTVSSGTTAVAASAPAIISSSTTVCPPASIAGYTITQSVDIKIHDFSKIGTIMSGVVKNGANQIGSLSFTIDDQTTAQNQARADAITKAKAKADSIAAAGGFTVGRLLNIQENSISPVYAPSVMMGLNAKSDAAVATPTIQAGSQEVDVNVTLQYEIK
jgi:uncharacterized protein YggE